MKDDAQTFTGQQAATAQTALRKALGLAPEQFPVPAFVGMVSDEVEQLRAKGNTFGQIAMLIEEAIGVDVSQAALADHFVSSEDRGHHGG